ncbi:MAG: sigma-70 family RNA polymerase sigma factor [Chloroflexales bacterium]|nr:sigma-70 family RNA polymerase sigma factor [Chloroflexales bacterium]
MPGPTMNLRIYADEAALLAGLQRRDPDACTCLVQRFAPQVYAHALRLTGAPDLAESILQTTFLTVCDALSGLDGISSLSTWIDQIALNESVQLLRRPTPQVARDNWEEALRPDRLPPQRVAWAPDPLHTALEAELRAEIAQAIAALPESLRLVVLLRDLQQRSTEETAAQLGLSAGAVKVRLHRARLRLRAALSRYLV